MDSRLSLNLEVKTVSRDRAKALRLLNQAKLFITEARHKEAGARKLLNRAHYLRQKADAFQYNAHIIQRAAVASHNKSLRIVQNRTTQREPKSEPRTKEEALAFAQEFLKRQKGGPLKNEPERNG